MQRIIKQDMNKFYMDLSKNNAELICTQQFTQPNITLSFKANKQYLEHIEVIAKEDITILLRNDSKTSLLAISDDVKVERFDDMIQRMYTCAVGEYHALTLTKGRSYQVQYVI